MTILTRILLTIILICLAAGAGPVKAQAPVEERVAQLMAQMSVEDKVGQLFLVPFVGDQVTPDSDIWHLLTEYRVGGVILLSANSNFRNDESAPGQITGLVNNLQTTAFNTNGIPLFVAIDHEGDAFPFTRISNSLTPIPSQMAIGATWKTANAEAIGQIVGEEMAVMGINMVLGPGLDVLNDPRPTGRGDIGIRVYGGDPFWVGQMGRAYIRGVHQGGKGQVITVAKHFPGHGGSDRLPDNEVATVDKSLQELRRIELPPFFEVTAASEEDPLGQTDALMSSHIRYRGFQGDIRQFTAPISFDAAGMSTLLALPQIASWRDDGGLIVSDALGVPAVRKHFDPALETFPHRRIAKEAFLAGNDVLSLVQFDLKSIWGDQFANIKDTVFFFRTEYNNNPTFAARVDAAVARILAMKLKLYPELTLNDLTHDPGYALEISNRPRPIVNKIAQESLTLLYPSPEELRLRVPAPPRSDEKVLIIVDARLARQCFIEGCEPEELYLTRTGLEETILRLYGPGATGQIQPEQVSTITFSELKLALGGSIAPISEPDGQPEDENKLVQRSVDEIRQLIQEA
ncbi:MAG: glycoside hydrolase family 3 N-terminal domain-containing protein, partial [Anaerolineae bacterium]|nr:glycoside hydrolase family 3 N-terminal domain-containing protein [Anaerolineae bacterium]